MQTNLNAGSLGLALGAGAVLGAVHIGVLKVLEERSIFPAYVAGTSIGAFIGALYAFEIPAKEIEKITVDLDWLKLTKISLTRFSLLSNARMAEMMTEVLGDVDIASAKRKLGIVATNLIDGSKVVLEKGSLSRAVMASASIPGLFSPIEWNGRFLIDGGLAENVPAATAMELGAEKVIAVDLTQHCNQAPKNIIDVLLNTFSITMMRLSKEQKQLAQVLIAPDLSDYNLWKTRRIPQLIELGYRHASEVLDQLNDSW